MGKKKTYIVAVVILALMLLTLPFLGACSAKQAGAKTLKIGVGASLTGPGSVVGLIYKHGFTMAADKINEDGGLNIGGDTYMIDLIVEDNGSSPDMTATAVTKLVHQDGAKFILGDSNDFNIPAFYEAASSGGALFIISWLSSSVVAKQYGADSEDVSPDRPLMIRLHPSVDEGLDNLLQYLTVAYPDVKTIGVSGLDLVVFDWFGPFNKDKFSNYGLQMAGDFERFSPTTTDFYPVVTRLLASNPDAMSLGLCPPDHFVLQVKAAREQGFTGPIFHLPPYDESFVAALSSPNLTDVFGNGTATGDPNLSKTVKDIIALGKDTYGDEFIADSVDNYDTMMIFAQVLEEAKSVDPEKVRDTFETMTKSGSLESIYGSAYVGGVKTTGVNRVLIKPVPLSRVVNGESEHLDYITTDIP
jgi:branched-chain amino acid transport system substrate-binding protein